jgi:allophanate hydrolase
VAQDGRDGFADDGDHLYASDPIKLNTNLGYYTNFVNLLDLAAVAVPAGFRTNGLPFGISFIGPAFTDEALLELADYYHRGVVPRGPTGCVVVAVVGAHLNGQPLNRQLTERGARLIKTCRTAAGYRLYALEGTVPAKPGLVRDFNFEGAGIEVEVWAVPENLFGGFVAGVPQPLGIGSATLENGEVVKCFICEGWAIEGAAEITRFGGWRNYLRGGTG